MEHSHDITGQEIGLAIFSAHDTADDTGVDRCDATDTVCDYGHLSLD
jgi:hypothetical protein